MNNKEFANNLCRYMEERIHELAHEFLTGNNNDATFPSFFMDLSSDIQSYMEENNLTINQDIKDYCKCKTPIIKTASHKAPLVVYCGKCKKVIKRK